jgi:hypothetical protein
LSELIFKGKEFVYNHHLAVPFRPLVPNADKSIGEARLDGNLIVHGDNLHALKALLPLYAGSRREDGTRSCSNCRRQGIGEVDDRRQRFLGFNRT